MTASKLIDIGMTGATLACSVIAYGFIIINLVCGAFIALMVLALTFSALLVGIMMLLS